MARSRILKPGFFSNEDLAALSFEARLCFAGLWTLADREGRLEDRPKRIDAALFPYDQVDIVAILEALTVNGFIRRYVANGVAVIDIPRFAEHQHPHQRELASQLPPYQDVATRHDLGTTRAKNRQGLSRAVSTSVSVSTSDSVYAEPAAEPRHTRAEPVKVPAEPAPRPVLSERPRGATLFSGRDHIAHVACGRICVPAFLHREFILALGGPEDMADQRLRDWYSAVFDAVNPDEPIESDAPKFWRPRFQSTFVKPGGQVAQYAGRQTTRLAAAVASIQRSES